MRLMWCFLDCIVYYYSITIPFMPRKGILFKFLVKLRLLCSIKIPTPVYKLKPPSAQWTCLDTSSPWDLLRRSPRPDFRRDAALLGHLAGIVWRSEDAYRLLRSINRLQLINEARPSALLLLMSWWSCRWDRVSRALCLLAGHDVWVGCVCGGHCWCCEWLCLFGLRSLDWGGCL